MESICLSPPLPPPQSKVTTSGSTSRIYPMQMHDGQSSDCAWLIRVSSNGSPRGENVEDAPERVEAHPSGTVVHRYTNIYKILGPYLPRTRPASFDPPTSSCVSNPSLVAKHHGLLFETARYLYELRLSTPILLEQRCWLRYPQASTQLFRRSSQQ
ncbi:hypothetical protein BKA70DRAFT_1515432 [Coprinopsis sp. MPI-PUGE-AT-0042]|nr:hypothetical protein BKA70DRAFT_1515432 [Coprinopsis sp. MPI-PUGE-AT-0042]